MNTALKEPFQEIIYLNFRYIFQKLKEIAVFFRASPRRNHAANPSDISRSENLSEI